MDDLPLVSADELASMSDVVVADVRWRFGQGPQRAAFEAGHIPGAVFVDLDADLSRPPRPGEGRHPLPEPRAFADTLTRLGIGEGVRVVACDDAGGAHGARLWWMLHVLGRPVSVLDGGVPAWSGPLEAGPSARRPPASRPYPAVPWPEERIVTLAEVEAVAAGTSDLVLLDARAGERYRAEVQVDPRPGHIPGAVSAELAGNLGADGRFLAPAELAERYRALRAGAGDVGVSCGSGVTACHDALAMVVAGLDLPRLYVGSYSEWIADPARSVAATAEPR